jgi:hypothetical protein
MYEPLKLHTHHHVTLFNKDMLLGGLMGAFLFAAGPGFAVPAVALTAATSLIGGLIGRKRLQKENHEGKVVTTPSLINKEAIIGGMAGAQVGLWVGLAAVATIVGLLVMPELVAKVGAEAITKDMLIQTLQESVNPLITAVGAWLTSIASGAGLGAYVGAKAGYKRMAREFDMAQEQQRGNVLTRSPSQEREREPELGKDKSFMQALEQERATVERNTSPSR